MLKTLPSMQGVRVQSLVGARRSHMPHAKTTKIHLKKNPRCNIVINSIETLKMVHIKKSLSKNKNLNKVREVLWQLLEILQGFPSLIFVTRNISSLEQHTKKHKICRPT